ncbi:hypothetical protein ACQPYA_12905 [Micromonospora sp. CA-263727]|uniref:hypothetical protein n=1 Tax=Micromonospora sp. CA-263727 TaxID=3239967 RepID=UPI003D8FCD4D
MSRLNFIGVSSLPGAFCSVVAGMAGHFFFHGEPVGLDEGEGVRGCGVEGSGGN